MAEERDDAQRTEEPTSRRLDEARSKGDVIKSPEVTSFIVLAAGALAVTIFSGMAARTFARHYLVFFERPAEFSLDAGSALLIFKQAAQGLLVLMAPAIGLMMVAGIGVQLMQQGLSFSGERLRPDFSRLSPIAGFKRLFGLDGIINLIKGIAKIILVGAAAFAVVWPERSRLATALDLEPAEVAALALSLIDRVLLAMLVIFALIAGLDYLYQRQRFLSRHRMTRQELKDEVKQSEGDPQIKARIRQIRLERAKKRMMAAIPEATVVITNPTHYAVALKYESGKMAAPVCVAKGVDHMALNIRKVAKEHEVPVVENPPLARALYASVELDDEIPAEHYKAVAQIIGDVLKLAEKNKFWRN
jgi:flagellar biosynthetic protein FlhB